MLRVQTVAQSCMHLDDAMNFGAIIISPPREPGEVFTGARCVAIIQFDNKVACVSKRHVIDRHASADREAGSTMSAQRQRLIRMEYGARANGRLQPKSNGSGHAASIRVDYKTCVTADSVASAGRQGPKVRRRGGTQGGGGGKASSE